MVRIKCGHQKESKKKVLNSAATDPRSGAQGGLRVFCKIKKERNEEGEEDRRGRNDEPLKMKTLLFLRDPP